jgi:hypothetical protein
MPLSGYSQLGAIKSDIKKKAAASNTAKVLPRSPIQPTSFDPARAGQSVASGAVGPYSQGSTAGTNPGASGTSGQGSGYSGFAKRYLEGPGPSDILQRQPEVLLGDLMKSRGMSNNGGMFGMVAPSADLANALYMLTNGGQLGTDNQMINWMANYFGQQLDPNGKGIDIRSALGNVFGGAGQNQQAPLGAFLTTDSSGNVLDPRGQVSRLSSLVDAASQYGVPLIMQQALSGAMGQLSRDYLSRSAQGGMSTGNYNDYINARQNNILRPFIGS